MLEHAFEAIAGWQRRRNTSRALPSRTSAPPSRHARGLVAVRLHPRRERPSHLYLPIPR
jgi:hypothetical protein